MIEQLGTVTVPGGALLIVDGGCAVQGAEEFVRVIDWTPSDDSSR